eukprot:CAMPEP_0174827634 /NCGR_PEP_ID=MMETSP1114-20130205/848_1 /TAXON_ID=312471 /ORGANISM="Neobodo designis, Strain CCAP 1951/1" /LENGTH=75 /DNA_ID=CAMNT_0016061305 /DNA_START=75 /DNA_END=299 /DNA_ORIENTATION=-
MAAKINFDCLALRNKCGCASGNLPNVSNLNVQATLGTVTDTAITAVAQRCPQLQHLNVQATRGKVTDTAITAVAQ